MLKQLREQVGEAWADLPVYRRPALRRSDAPDALLATDLPLAAGPETVVRFTQRMLELGWRVMQAENGWLLLDGPVPEPEAVMPGNLHGECGCCMALLVRHPDAADASAEIRAVVKAAEAGKRPFERLCRQLHGMLAGRLRRHEKLPGMLLPYLCKAYHDLYDGRNV